MMCKSYLIKTNRDTRTTQSTNSRHCEQRVDLKAAEENEL